MKVVDPSKMKRSRAAASVMYDEIAQADVGTTFELVRGTDFASDDEMRNVRQRVVAAMLHRGYRVQTSIDGDDRLYVRTVGEDFVEA